jgi:hypothetical protein
MVGGGMMTIRESPERPENAGEVELIAPRENQPGVGRDRNPDLGCEGIRHHRQQATTGDFTRRGSYQIHSFYGKWPVVACVTCGPTEMQKEDRP